MPEGVRSLTGWRATLLVVIATCLVAGLARLPWLAASPPGFSLTEARAALYARGMTGSDLLPRPGPLDTQEPVFSGLLWSVGSLAGWDVSTARLPAAMLGILAAIACACWYRRVLGTGYGLAGGLLIATGFSWLVLSRQAQPAIGAAACAGLALWCLWEGLDPEAPQTDRPDPSQRGGWLIAAGTLFGLGLYVHPALLPGIIAGPACAAVLIWRRDGGLARREGRWLATGLGCMLLIAAPLVINTLREPSDLRQRIEQDWNADGRTEQIALPSAAIDGVAETLVALGWDGHDTPTLGGPNRPILDPILLLLTVAGLVVVLARPLAPLHSLALLWLVSFGAPVALLDPGNPALLMPLTPVLVLLPLLGVRAVLRFARPCGELTARLALLIVAGSIAGSVAWSLVGYWNWSHADTTYFAFNADLIEALAAVDQLAIDSDTVYIATTPDLAPLLDYLGPRDTSAERGSTSGRVQRAIDSRTTLVIPADGLGYVVTHASRPLPPALSRLLESRQPVEAGEAPEGAAAWQIWAGGQTVRDQIPWTLPALTFPDGFELAGFDIRPDLGDIATTGQLPDPPRVSVTLVWSVSRGATPHIARVRLVPTGDDIADPEGFATTAEMTLTTSPPIAAGNRGRELIIVQMVVPVPDSPDLIIDVQAGLARADGQPLPPTNAGASTTGDYARLNRVQYVRDSTTNP